MGEEGGVGVVINEVMNIGVDKIQPNFRALYNLEEIEQLMHSIEDCGQQEPITLWFGGHDFRILDGEKRWRACKRLGLTHMKAITVWSTGRSQTRPR
jgi:ParB-like chromosome segregation protein Spo0J